MSLVINNLTNIWCLCYN